jgi:PEP-CTERM motif
MTTLTLASIRSCSASVLLALLLPAPCTMAGTTTQVVTEARSAPNMIGTSGDHTECPGCLASASNTGTVIDPVNGTSQSDGVATALAEHGVLKTFASSASSGAYGYASARATAAFSDTLMIDSPGHSGQSGMVIIPLQFDYAATLIGQLGYAGSDIYLTLDVFMGAGSYQWQRGLLMSPDGSVQSQSFDAGGVVVPFDDTILASVSFTFGQEFSFIASLRTHVSGSLEHQAIVDASHSAYWGGVQSVLDQNGNPVVYTLNSSSGTDWSRFFVPSPVPEPATSALMVAGLGVIVAATRRRRFEA